jgi:D-sedoheptulose 7-phosphate isomerase
MGDIMDYPIKYLKKLQQILNDIEIRDTDNDFIFHEAVNIILKKIRKLKDSENKLIFIGNGGSAAIASHQAVDYWKSGNIPAISFNDASLLTCISNDYGYEFVFEKPINMHGKSGDILIAISSSGQSENILNAVNAAKKKGLFVITMSGFSEKNPLRNLGDLNFYVPSKSYGHVEIAHLIICHTILDTHLNTKL